VAQLAVALVSVATLVPVLEAQALSAEVLELVSAVTLVPVLVPVLELEETLVLVLELVPALEATEPTMLKLLQLKQHGRFIIWTLD
jgi:hypothetical protein